MRDDVKAIVAELSRCHREKLHRLQKLLLSESDKLHYEKSENLEKIFDIVDEDARTIDEINLIDFDIARAESKLSALIGVKTAELYDHLGPRRAVEELLSIRNQMRKSLERLYRERIDLASRLQSASRKLKDSIDEISRIGRLRRADEEKKTR